jgi:hypothetical protein
VRIEEVGAAGRAQAGDLDVGLGHAGVDEHELVGPPEVEVAPVLVDRRAKAARRGHIGFDQHFFGVIRPFHLDRHDDFVADFVTARADGRTDAGKEVLGLRAEGFLHLTDGLARNPRDGAAPAGVRDADRARDRVVEKDGGAVGGENDERSLRAVGDQRIGVVESAAFVTRRHVRDVRLMYLLPKYEMVRLFSDDIGGALAVFTHAVGFIPGLAAEIERRVRAGAHAAVPRGNNGVQAWVRVVMLEREKPNAVSFALDQFNHLPYRVRNALSWNLCRPSTPTGVLR